MKIKVHTGYNDYKREFRAANFEVIEALPELEPGHSYASYNGEIVKRIEKAYLDPEQPTTDVYNYSYYYIITEDDEEDETYYPVACYNGILGV